ncbi:MAG: hypothetical protein WDO15_06255 [Bacteroidota bacterium]
MRKEDFFKIKGAILEFIQESINTDQDGTQTRPTLLFFWHINAPRSIAEVMHLAQPVM